MSKIGQDVIGAPPKIGGKDTITQLDNEKAERQIKQYLATAKVVALSKSPFLYSILSGAEIRLTNKVPVAAVDKHGILYINPKGFQEVAPEPKQGVSLLLHETLHIGLGHFKRLMGPQTNHQVANIAEDAVINNALEESGYLIDLPIYKEGKLVNMETISTITNKSVGELKDKDAEEIYDTLMGKAKQQQKGQGQQQKGQGQGQQQQQQQGQGGQQGQGDIGNQITQEAEKEGGWGEKSMDTALGKGKELGEDSEGEGNVVQKGNPDLYKRDPVTGEKEYDNKAGLNKAKVDAEMLGKGMGTMPSGLARMVNKLTEAKVNWRSQLRTQLSRGLGSLVVSSWQVPSRRWGDYDYPGTRMVTKPNVFAVLDTSGSISEEQLEQFLSEVYSISRNYGGRVSVLPFDAEEYEIVEARTPSDIIHKVIPKMKGGGGTEIEPAITHLLNERKFRPKDAVVIMSDGDIFDIEKNSVKDKMNRLANNSSCFIFLTIRRPKEELRPLLPRQTKLLEVSD